MLVRFAFVFGALTLVVTTLAGWLAYRANQINVSLDTSIGLASSMQGYLLAGDLEAARIAFNEIQNHTDRALAAGTDPLWKAAGLVPVVGPNFSAVTEITVSANDVIDGAVGPLLDDPALLDLESFSPSEGQIDVQKIQSAAPSISSAASTVQHTYERLSAIDRTNLLDRVASPLNQATDSLDGIRQALNKASDAATLLPGMLGADGQRNYLVLVQNSAEVRATGGIPGALAIISANDGRIALETQGSATQMGRFDPAIIADPDQAQIYSSRMGRFMQSVNLTPDFPTAAQTAVDMWEERNVGDSIHGVVALDPIVLRNILQSTGPVELGFEDEAIGELVSQSGLPTSLSADNVVSTMLSDVYAAIDDPQLQDAYFSAVAAEVFATVESGGIANEGIVRSLIGSTEQKRLFVWSADRDEQEIIATTGLAGKVTGPGSGGATFGAYFNDGTGAKMDYYVRRTAQLHRSCTPEGYLQYTLVATLTNTAPTDAAEALPAYVTGGGAFGVPEGTVQTNFVGYGPDQSQLQTARIDGEPVPLGSYRHGDRPVGILTTRLDPGQSATVELDFTNVVQHSEPSLDITPTIQPLNEVVLPVTGDTECRAP